MAWSGSLTSEAAAAEVRVSSRTLGEGYMVRVPGPAGVLLSRRRVVQYVGLGAYHLLPPKQADELVRDVRDGQLQVVMSMRLRHDFGTFMRDATGDDERLVGEVDQRQIDILYGYLEGQRIGGWVDFKLGRQFEMSGLDFYAFDGGWMRLRTPVHLAAEAFVGVAIDGTDVFGFPTFELDGTQGTQADRALSPTVGAGFSTIDSAFLDARFMYRRTWTPGAINDELGPIPTLVGTTIDQELVSASAALRLAKGRVSPFAAGRYNLGTNRIDDVTAGLTWSITPIHLVRAMYLRTIPAFDLDSVFNAFASEPFEDIRVAYEVQATERLRLYGRFQGRLFRAETTAELGTEPPDVIAFGGGGGAGARWQARRFAVLADAFGLGGRGGVRAGANVDTRTHIVYDRIALDGRTYFVYYRDEFTAERRGYSLAFALGANFKLAHGIYLNLVGEQMFTSFYKTAFRAFGLLSFDWAFRAGGRA